MALILLPVVSRLSKTAGHGSHGRASWRGGEGREAWCRANFISRPSPLATYLGSARAPPAPPGTDPSPLALPARQVYGIPADRLYVTYFEGDAAQGLEVDAEARQLWLEVGVPEDHILTGNAKVRPAAGRDRFPAAAAACSPVGHSPPTLVRGLDSSVPFAGWTAAVGGGGSL